MSNAELSSPAQTLDFSIVTGASANGAVHEVPVSGRMGAEDFAGSGHRSPAGITFSTGKSIGISLPRIPVSPCGAEAAVISSP